MPPHEVLASPVALLVQLIPCSCMLDGVRAPLGPSCRMAKMTGFQTERTKPFPITELDFSGNLITSEGIGAVVQFARTQGMDATVVDTSSGIRSNGSCTTSGKLVPVRQVAQSDNVWMLWRGAVIAFEIIRSSANI